MIDHKRTPASDAEWKENDAFAVFWATIALSGLGLLAALGLARSVLWALGVMP